MKNKRLCHRIGEEQINVEKTAKGWRINFTHNCDDLVDGMQYVDAIMTLAEEIMKDHNKMGENE